MAVNADMNQILEWLGFANAPQRTQVLQDIPTLESLADITEQEIGYLAEEYSKRTVTDGRFFMGLERTKLLKATVHWTQDFGRLGGIPSIVGLNAATFKAQVRQARDRATIRQELDKQNESISKEAAPGKLKSEKEWEKWEKQLKNYLSTIYGAWGIPLVYVIRDNDAGAPNAGNTFVQECIACVPLQGVKFQADARQVHIIIMTCVEGETSEEWVKKLKRQENGRSGFKALYNHYEGAGKTGRRISQAENIRDNIFYKSERALPFATFLNRLQTMFNIYEDEEEPYTEAAKTRFLFDKIQNPSLKDAVQALKTKDTIDGNVDFTVASNYLSGEVSKLPEFKSSIRNVSGSKTSGMNPDILNADGSVNTGFIQGWRTLSKEDRQIIHDERAKTRTGKGKNGKTNKPPSHYKKTFSKQKAELKSLNTKLEEQTRIISQLKRTNKTDDDGDEIMNDAGNQFGGRQAKKGKKNQS